MWGEILGWLKFFTSIVKDARPDAEERAAQRRQLRALALSVELLFERDEQRQHEEALRRKDDEQRRADEAHEREKLLLRLKIQLLEFERRLPPPPPGAPPPPSLDQD